ncbi:MAG: hypothetical protein NDI94_06170 [Candidatus Woesearchaeota archaeon]|nr:hypothetical protein [Candidatus Woesearchaeota archaeon]
MVVTTYNVMVAEVTNPLLNPEAVNDFNNSLELETAVEDIIQKLSTLNQNHIYHYQGKNGNATCSNMVQTLNSKLIDRFHYSSTVGFHTQFLDITDEVRTEFFPNMSYWMVNLYRRLIPESHTGLISPAPKVDLMEAASMKGAGAREAARRLVKKMEPVETSGYPSVEGATLIYLKKVMPWLDINTLFGFNGGGQIHLLCTYNSGIPKGINLRDMGMNTTDAALFSMFPSERLKSRDFYYEDTFTKIPPWALGSVDPIILMPADMDLKSTYLEAIERYLSSFATVAYGRLGISGQVVNHRNDKEMRSQGFMLLNDFTMEYAGLVKHAMQASQILLESSIEPVYKFLGSAGLMKGIIHVTELIAEKVNDMMVRHSYMHVNEYGNFDLDNLNPAPRYLAAK